MSTYKKLARKRKILSRQLDKVLVGEISIRVLLRRLRTYISDYDFDSNRNCLEDCVISGQVFMDDKSKPQITIHHNGTPFTNSIKSDLLGVMIHEYAHKLQRAAKNVEYEPVDQFLDHEEVFAYAVELASLIIDEDIPEILWHLHPCAKPYVGMKRNSFMKIAYLALCAFKP